MARAPRDMSEEAPPEADCLDGFLHPRFTPRLFGHQTAEMTLGRALAGDRVHHAWLISGPEGIGKATLAYRFACATLSKEIAVASLIDAPPTALEFDPEAPACHQVRALSHPDLLLLRRPYDIKAKRFKTAITVEEVRRLRGFLGHKATGNARKVVIVDAADELNINAANALLKSLEEPPAGTVFVLLSATPGRLLTTIRSRCRHLALEPLGAEDLEAAARQAFTASEAEMPEDTALTGLIGSAGGSVRRLLNLATQDGISVAQKVDRLLANVTRTDWPAVHALADEFSSVSAAPKFDMFIDLLLRQVGAAVRAGSGAPAEANAREMAEKLRMSGDLASWAELWETLVREKAVLDTLNLDRKGYVLDCVMRMRALAAGQPA